MQIKRKFVFTCLLALSAVWAAAAQPAEPKSAAAPRLDRWRVLGPGGGGAMYFPTVSPHDPRVVLLRCDMGGAYITHDGGESWRMFHLRGTVEFFAFDPADANVMYAASIALWRSNNRGESWRLSYPASDQLDRIELSGDHAEERVITKDGREPRMDALAIDPANPKRLYLAIRDAKGGASVQVSNDAGISWNLHAPLPGVAKKMWVTPADRKLIVATRDAILEEKEKGVWTGRTAPGDLIDVAGGFDGRQGPLKLYATSAKGIHHSGDTGRSWETSNLGGAVVRYPAIATSLYHPQTAYVSFAGRTERDGAFGIAKTTDGGQTWNPVWKDEPNSAAANAKDAWINDRFGPTWGENPLTIGVAPHNPDLCYTTDLGRAMRTSDGGKTWHAVYSRKASGSGGVSWTSTGLDVTNAYGIHFDPHASNRVFATFTDIGLFRSEDGGSSWISASQGVPDPWVNTAYWMEFDPAVKGRAWAAVSGAHDLPRPKMWRRTPVSKFEGGVVETSDGGLTWKALAANLPQGAATHILLDPQSSQDARTLYVTLFGRGVYKSTDGGRNWTQKNNGIEGAEPFAWRLTQSQDRSLWLVVARRSEDGGAGNALDGALYRSTDGAEHWTRVALPEGVNGPNGITVDARDPKRLYLSLWGRAARPANRNGGVLLSNDGGETWKPVLERDQNIYDVTQDLKEPNVLYACGFASSVWRSADRGATWQRLRGYNFKWGQRVIVDPHRANRIFVTTFGGGIWYGPATGDPNAAEDIATPQAGLAQR